MDEDRPARRVPRRLSVGDQFVDVVPVDRPDVMESHVLESVAPRPRAVAAGLLIAALLRLRARQDEAAQ